MKYQVHQLKVQQDTARETLENFLHTLSGEVVSVMPYAVPRFFPFGAAAKVVFLLIIEKKA